MAIPLSARMKGVVFGSVDDGVTNYVANLGDLSRGEQAGYYAQGVGAARVLRPRMSVKDYEALQLSRLPEVEGFLESHVASLRFVDDAFKKRFLKTRKAVQQPTVDGDTRIIIVPRVPDAMSEYEIMKSEEGMDMAMEYVSAVEAADLEAREKKRVYNLAQVMSDVSVLDKYNLTGRMIETAKRMTVSDPRSAALMLQDAMNTVQDKVNVVVKAGDYVKDKGQARIALGNMCRNYKPTSAVVLSEVIGETLFMYGPKGVEDWHVSGHLQYASQVSYVYWMVKDEGPIIVSTLLSLELTMLRIDVFDGFSSAEPEWNYHVALPDSASPLIGLSSRTTGLLSAEQRVELEGMHDRLLPVMASDGLQIATAVRVTDKHVLVNSHVAEADPLSRVSGVQLCAQRQMSRDLWSMELCGSASPWKMRNPVEGERVAICYSSGNTVSCSSPLTVLSVDRTAIVTTLDPSVVPGLSGGALVALDDLSLLGVHSAGTLTSLISFRFGPDQLSGLLDDESVSNVSRDSDPASFAAKTIDRFRRKGMYRVVETALRSMVPVYVGVQHMGMAVHNGDYLYTTCDAELPLRFGESRLAYPVETVELESVYRAQILHSVVDSPVFRRTPVVFEKVFIAGNDGEPYLSLPTTVVHVGPNARSFTLDDVLSADKPLVGGLVMSKKDGAVLGICGARSTSTYGGIGYVCWPLPQLKAPAKLEKRAVLMTRFPFLNIPAWPDDIIEELFTHSSVGRYKSGNRFNAGMKPLANVGDNAAKSELYASMRHAGIPHAQWSIRMQEVQSNAKFARLAWDLGYAECLDVGLGATFSPTSKAYADLTEALLGAAYECETRAVFKQLCAVMGILAKPEGLAIISQDSDSE